jgi:hypothetical protein
MWLAPIWLFADSFAQEPAADDAVEEVVVWGDLFARWDDTRWMITNELIVPYRFLLRKDENAEFGSREMQARAVIACEKDWKLGIRRYEVSCEIEDFAIQAAIDEDRVNEDDIARAQSVLDEIDAKLSGADIQLQVSDDGRVTNLDLEALTASTQREREIQESLRQILSRMVVGFDLRLRKYNQLNEGKWHEYNSKLMALPRPPEITGGSQTGSSLVVHYLNKYQGHLVVQSIGKGLDQITIAGASRASATPGGDAISRNFTIDLIGVSIFDQDEGFMLERVWALKGAETASSFFGSGGYANNGRIAMLGTNDKPDCGPTRVVNGRNQAVSGLPKWEPIEK